MSAENIGSEEFESGYLKPTEPTPLAVPAQCLYISRRVCELKQLQRSYAGYSDPLNSKLVMKNEGLRYSVVTLTDLVKHAEQMSEMQRLWKRKPRCDLLSEQLM